MIFCWLSVCIRFRLTVALESSILNITFQSAVDLNTVLRELSGLSITISYEQSSYDQNLTSGASPFGSGKPHTPTYELPSNTVPSNTSTPHPTVGSTAQGPYPPGFEDYPPSSSLQWPPSQPVGPPTAFRADQRPWSPAFVPSRPATTIGIPGILGEGIYKVSKIGAASSSRSRARRTTAVFEQKGPRVYAVPKPPDKAASKIDALHATSDWHKRRKLSSSLQDDSIRHSTMPTAPGASNDLTQGNLWKDNQSGETFRDMSDSTECFSTDLQRQARIKRLVTADNNTFEEATGYASSQPKSSQNDMDDTFMFESSPTLLELPIDSDTIDDWLIQVSQVQHQGLAQASGIWDDLGEKARKDLVSAQTSDGLTNILSKYEKEFVERWDGVVAATAHRLREVRQHRV